MGAGALPALPPPSQAAAWAADTLDEIWLSEGAPDPFVYVEVGAGDGSLARDLLRLGPRCLEALRVVLVEDDRAIRERHAEFLSIESPALILGPVAPSDDPDEGNRPVPGIGPLVTSLAELPALSTSSVGVVIAYEWLSRQASDRYLWRDGKWWEIRLAAPPSDDGGLVDIALPVPAETAAAIEAMVGNRLEGGEYAAPVGAVSWFKGALGTAENGWLVAVDRWTEKAEPLGGGTPSVALDQLASVRVPAAGPSPAFGDLGAVRWRLG